jgi:hypothetical protein
VSCHFVVVVVVVVVQMSWSGEASVEDDYRTESTFHSNFQEQQHTWAFQPYGHNNSNNNNNSNSDNNDDNNEHEGNGGQEVEPAEDTLVPPTYIKPATWIPHVRHLEHGLHQVSSAVVCLPFVYTICVNTITIVLCMVPGD